MKSHPQIETRGCTTGRDTDCLVRTVAAAMAQEPALEAVKIDRDRKSISLATLGRPRNQELEQVVAKQVNQVRQAAGGHRCRLLEAAEDCSQCDLGKPGELQRALTVQHDAGVTTIARVTCPTAPTFWRWRNIPWPKLVPREIVLEEDDAHADEWKAQLAAAALCGALALAAAVAGAPVLRLALFLAAYVAGSWFTVEEIWERLQKGTLDVHFLMLTVAIGSASIGAWGEGATLLFLFSFSGALEHYAMGRTQREIRSLFKTAPKTATVLDAQGREHVTPVPELRPGQRLLLRPGEQFPVDGEIAKGRTAADESNLTGEAVPVEKSVGDAVLAGTLNQWGGVEVIVTRPASQSALQKIIHLIREAQHLKAPAQRFTDKFSTGYTYAILGLSAGMFFVWWLGFGIAPFTSTGATRSAFYRAMTLLVVASPCALVLSIPSAILAAIAWGARRGILFRGGAAVEKLADVTVVAMDKTGTLTTGELQVERVESFPPGREADLARIAYSLERLSAHPLARAITRQGKQQQIEPLALEHFESVTGQGLRAQSAAGALVLGRREWVLAGATHAERLAAPAVAPGLSEVWVAGDGVVGRLLLRDDVRPESRALVEQLRRKRIHTLVLTGDQPAAAQFLQEHCRPDEVRAGLKPEQKVEAIAQLTQAGQRVAMIGDGVNDAPSLAAAHVGVAMGARGSDAALEQAEVVLMHDRLENFLRALELSQRARRIIRQNLVISLGIVVVLVTFAVLGRIPLTLGVVGHEGSTVVVVMNSLRLLLARQSSRE